MNRDIRTGLVLAVQDYAERDAILTIAFEDGVSAVFAKGVRTPASKNRRLCNVYSKVRLELDKKPSGMDRLIRGDLLFYAGHILESLDMQAANLAIAEVAAQTNLTPRLLDLLEQLWRQCEAGDKRWKSMACCLMAQILKEEGLAPWVDGCVVCGGVKVDAMSLEHAGFLCPDHSRGRKKWPKDRLQKMRALFKAEPDQTDILLDTFDYDLEDLVWLLDHYGRQNQQELHSAAFLKTILRMV